MSSQAIAVNGLLRSLFDQRCRLGSDFEVVVDHGTGNIVFRGGGIYAPVIDADAVGRRIVEQSHGEIFVLRDWVGESVSAVEPGVDSVSECGVAQHATENGKFEDSRGSTGGRDSVEVDSKCCCGVLDTCGVRGRSDIDRGQSAHGEERSTSGGVSACELSERACCNSRDDSGGSVDRGSGSVVRDPFGAVESKVERNRRWRAEAKEKKKKRQQMGVDWRKKKTGGGFLIEDLRESSVAKWKFQNELAAEKAKRELEVLRANDLEQEIRRYRTKVSSQTERNMVAIEKTHAYLKSTGNVPGVAPVVVPGLDHDVHTVSDTISPDSSASQHEFRMCQKKLLDCEKKVEDLLAVLKKMGVSPLVAENFDKETFTDDTVGNEIYQEMYGDVDDVIHHVLRDGKKKFKIGLDPDAFA